MKDMRAFVVIFREKTKNICTCPPEPFSHIFLLGKKGLDLFLFLTGRQFVLNNQYLIFF